MAMIAAFFTETKIARICDIQYKACRKMGQRIITFPILLESFSCGLAFLLLGHDNVLSRQMELS